MKPRPDRFRQFRLLNTSHVTIFEPPRPQIHNGRFRLDLRSHGICEVTDAENTIVLVLYDIGECFDPDEGPTLIGRLEMQKPATILDPCGDHSSEKGDGVSWEIHDTDWHVLISPPDGQFISVEMMGIPLDSTTRELVDDRRRIVLSRSAHAKIMASATLPDIRSFHQKVVDRADTHLASLEKAIASRSQS